MRTTEKIIVVTWVLILLLMLVAKYYEPQPVRQPLTGLGFVATCLLWILNVTVGWSIGTWIGKGQP